MNEIDKILEKNYEQLDILKVELSNLKEIKNRIEVLIGSNDKLPIIFSERFDKIVKVANDFTDAIGNSVNIFLEGNNDLLNKNNIDFSNKIAELSTEISRLVEVDFNTLFQEIETKFLENSKVEIRKELDKFDEKTKSLQNKIDDLSNEISRLSKIDLEEHFNRHQSKLSEVFISVNGINSVITSISQNINKIIQNFGDFEQSLLKTQKEITKNFDILTENQKESSRKLIEKLTETDIKINAITTQNEMLKKELDFNKKLSFGIVVLVIISIIISLI